jgi:hypothetical protein
MHANDYHSWLIMSGSTYLQPLIWRDTIGLPTHVAQSLRRGGCMLCKLSLDSGILFLVIHRILFIAIIITSRCSR